MGVQRSRLETGVLLGLGLALAAIISSNLIDGSNLLALLNPAAGILILGGTLGATAVSTRWSNLMALPSSVVTAFRSQKIDLSGEIERMVAFAQKTRRDGLFALEDEVQKLDNTFLKRGLQMVIDGADADAVRSVLRIEGSLRARAGRERAQVFETAGGYAPTMGIIGTVMGLVHVLANLSNVAALGPSIATAFLATFYGICTANVFWLPMASRLHNVAAEERVVLDVYLEGILSIQAGDNPSAVRDKLLVFLQPERAPKSPTPPPAPSSPDAAVGEKGSQVA